MLTNSREIVRRLEREGWTLVRITGSHHVFKNPISGETLVVPHPKKDLGKGLVPRHSDYDWLIPSQFRMGRSPGATRTWMLRATPG